MTVKAEIGASAPVGRLEGVYRFHLVLREQRHDREVGLPAIDQLHGDDELFTILGASLAVDPDRELIFLLVGGAGQKPGLHRQQQAQRSDQNEDAVHAVQPIRTG